jgi:hypothetical protein
LGTIAGIIALLSALWIFPAGAARACAPLDVFVSILPQKCFVERAGGAGEPGARLDAQLSGARPAAGRYF